MKTIRTAHTPLALSLSPFDKLRVSG